MLKQHELMQLNNKLVQSEEQRINNEMIAKQLNMNGPYHKIHVNSTAYSDPEPVVHVFSEAVHELFNEIATCKKEIQLRKQKLNKKPGRKSNRHKKRVKQWTAVKEMYERQLKSCQVRLILAEVPRELWPDF